MSDKAGVKRLVTACEGLDEEEKRCLRRLLDQNIVGIDSMTNNSTLIEIPELKLVISDNLGN